MARSSRIEAAFETTFMITRRKFFSGTAAFFGASALAQRFAGSGRLLAAPANNLT
jgi:hypothetical protein